MASPSAMAKCLLADAKLMSADMDREEFAQMETMARDVLVSVDGAVSDMSRPGDDTKIILMLATAFALEVE